MDKPLRRRRKFLLKALVWYCALFYAVDLPRVLSTPPRIYLAKSMTGRLDCPTEANPPVTLVDWTKDDESVQYAETTRLKVF